MTFVTLLNRGKGLLMNEEDYTGRSLNSEPLKYLIQPVRLGAQLRRLVGEIKSAAIAAFAYAYPEYLTLCLSHSLPQ